MNSIDVTQFKRVFSAWEKIMRENKEYLIKLDGVAGDSDLGLTMTDGFTAANRYAQESNEQDLGMLIYYAGKAILSKAPSSLGTLLGNGFLEAGKALKGRSQIDPEEVYKFIEAIEIGVQKRGNAKVGDKTFLDGIDPAIPILKKLTAENSKTVLSEAAIAAKKGSDATVGMLAKHGRMAIRGEDSRSYIDPGSVVGALLIQGLRDGLLEG